MKPSPKRCKTQHNAAFTLFELILAIALSVALVALIGTAITLYLTRVDASRTEVEQAQLARSILAMIADDIRATTVYKPQDLSAIEAMAANTSAFDVDSIDDERSGGSGGGGSVVDDIDAPSSGGSGGSGSVAGAGSGQSSFGTGATGGGQMAEPESTLPLGLSGTLEEIYVDVTRLPRRDELFATATGYTNAPIGLPAGGMAASATAAAATGMTKPSDLKSVRYFLRPGQQPQAGDAGVTSLDAKMQAAAGGLVRQEVPRTMRVWAEQSGSSTVLDSGQSLLAPEVVHLEFRYFDGTQVTDLWDMRERNSLPVAIEVRLWIANPGAAAPTGEALNAAALANTAREYRQTVYLPMSQLAGPGAQGGMGGAPSGPQSTTGSSTSGSTSGTSTTGGGPTSGGPTFGQF